MRARESRRWNLWRPLLTFALLLAVATGPLPGQGEGGGDLGARIEALYTVSTAPEGVELTPREPRFGVRSVVVSGGEVRVNGASVPEPALRAWLGEEAELILLLAELPPRQRRELFGLEVDDLAPAPPPAPVEEEPPRAELAPGPEGEPAIAPEAPEIAEGPEVPDLSEAPEPPPAPEAPALAERPRYHTGSQFTLFNDLRIQADESAREAVAVFGSVTVEGEVRGDVTAVMGSVWIDGRVDGEVVAVNGSVHLGADAEVLRGVTAVGGEVERAEGAQVRGATTEVPFSGLPRTSHRRPGDWEWRGPFWAHPGGFFSQVWSLFWRLVLLAVIALFLCLTVLLAPRGVGRVAGSVAAEWWKAGLVGLLGLVLFVPALALLMAGLAITIIGLILVVPLALVLPFLVFAAWLLSYAGVSLALGRWLQGRLGWGWDSPYAQALLGFAALETLCFLGRAGMALSGWTAPFGWLLFVVGWIIYVVALIVGFGALILTRFGRSPSPLPQEAAPAPPPPPAGGELPAAAQPAEEPAGTGGSEDPADAGSEEGEREP